MTMLRGGMSPPATTDRAQTRPIALKRNRHVCVTPPWGTWGTPAHRMRGSMKIELQGTIRGEDVRVVWSEGALTGNAALIKRVQMLQSTRDRDLRDCTEAIRALELAAGQRLHLRVLDPTPSSEARSLSESA
jgi:hypothetical protein